MSEGATKVSRVFIEGKTPKSFARQQARKAHNPNYRLGKLDGWQMNAVQRRKELDQLARLRRRNGAEFGPESGWIEVIANHLRVRNGQVNAKDVVAEAAWLGLPVFDPQLVDDAVSHIARAAWGKYQLYSAKLAGHKLRLTKVERQAAEINKIEAYDETKKDRRAREAREARARERASRPTLRTMAEVVEELAFELGVSPATVYRRIKSGEIKDCEISRRRSISPSEITAHEKILTPGEVVQE